MSWYDNLISLYHHNFDELSVIRFKVAILVRATNGFHEPSMEAGGPAKARASL
jgi:hypothetical protein